MMIKSVIKQIAMGLLLLFATMINVQAQEKTEFPLRVGDKMPDIEFHTMVNYPGGKAKLSDFAGKSVILDLWHVQCSACIQGMPKLQELQDKFKERIQIVGFGMNNISDYRKLIKTSSILKALTTLPLALQADTPLFKNLTGVYPTHIWIDRDGIIRAITSTVNATEKHIQDFLDGKALTFIMEKPRNQPKSYFPRDTSLLAQGNGENLRRLQYHSLFSGRVAYKSTLGSNYFQLGPVKPGIRLINVTLLKLLVGYWKTYDGSPKLVLQSEDLKKHLVPKNDDEYDQWYQNNTYCYELSLPEGRTYSNEIVNEYIRQDVQRFFGVKIERKPYLTNCLILYRLNDKDRVKTKGVSMSKEFDSGMTYGIERKDVSMSSIAELIQGQLSWRQEPVKVIDETGYTGNVDMKFDHKLDDINLVRTSLKKYGLGLKEEQRVVDCIVISKAE